AVHDRRLDGSSWSLGRTGQGGAGRGRAGIARRGPVSGDETRAGPTAGPGAGSPGAPGSPAHGVPGAPPARVRSDFDRIALLDRQGWDANAHYHDRLLEELPARMGARLDLGYRIGAFTPPLRAAAEPV